jgi:MmyB-like transcription regulator ligand binding domain
LTSGPSTPAARRGDPAFAALVTELADRSLTFRAWWAEHDVHVVEPARKRILHQTYGPLDLLQMQTRPTHRSSLQLRILAPADDVTRAALEVIDAARRGTDR